MKLFKILFGIALLLSPVVYLLFWLLTGSIVVYESADGSEVKSFIEVAQEPPYGLIVYGLAAFSLLLSALGIVLIILGFTQKNSSNKALDPTR
jgi:hypothetical protein